MDWKGQSMADLLYVAIVAIMSGIGFVWGWWVMDFWTCLNGVGAGVAIAMVAVVPDWGVFNKNPIAWQPKLPAEMEEE
jgi:hypothetical protein